MAWILTALVGATAAGWVAIRRGERGRLRAWRGSLVLAAIGFTSGMGGAATGNGALFYGGAFVALVGTPLVVVLGVAVYRDRQGTLDPTRHIRP